MDTTATFKIISPVIWLAAVAFMAGFISYLAFSGAAAFAEGRPHPPAAMVSGPASEEWNFPKRI